MSERAGPVDDKEMRERVERAAEMLTEKMQEDEELRRIAGTLLFSYRLAYWCISEVCAREGMTNEMAQWLIQAQDMAAKQSFNFVELMEDLTRNRMSWLESRRREALARQNTLKKKAKAMSQALRRQDIPLPWHSMTALFEEAGFRHGDMLLVFGPREALGLVLRRCSLMYRKTGGQVLFLSTSANEEYDAAADRFMQPTGWRNSCDIQASASTLLDPLLRGTTKSPVGLLVVEDLGNMLTERVAPMPRNKRLERAYMILKQHQADSGYAAIVGVPTDDDPGTYPDELHSPGMLEEKGIRLALSEPLIIGGEPVVGIGNDTESMAEMHAVLKEGK